MTVQIRCKNNIFPAPRATPLFFHSWWFWFRQRAPSWTGTDPNPLATLSLYYVPQNIQTLQPLSRERFFQVSAACLNESSCPLKTHWTRLAGWLKRLHRAHPLVGHWLLWGYRDSVKEIDCDLCPYYELVRVARARWMRVAQDRSIFRDLG